MLWARWGLIHNALVDAFLMKFIQSGIQYDTFLFVEFTYHCRLCLLGLGDDFCMQLLALTRETAQDFLSRCAADVLELDQSFALEQLECSAHQRLVGGGQNDQV